MKYLFLLTCLGLSACATTQEVPKPEPVVIYQGPKEVCHGTDLRGFTQAYIRANALGPGLVDPSQLKPWVCSSLPIYDSGGRLRYTKIECR